MRLRKLTSSFVCGVLLLGCRRQTGTKVGDIGTLKLGIKFGTSVDGLRKSRPEVRYVPDVGWIETLPQGSALQTITYEFRPGGPSWFVKLFGRLDQVHLRASEPTDSLIRVLDEQFSGHSYEGCQDVSSEDSTREVALLRWGGGNQEKQQVVGEIMVRRARDRVEIAGPMNLFVTPLAQRVGEVDVASFKSQCFSASVPTLVSSRTAKQSDSLRKGTR